MTSDFDLDSATEVEGFDLNSATTVGAINDYHYVEPDGDYENIYVEQTGETINAPKGVGRDMMYISNDDVFDPEPSSVWDEAGATYGMQSAYLAVLSGAYDLVPDENIASYYADRRRTLARAQENQPEYMNKFNNDFKEAKGFFAKGGVIISNPRAIGRMTISQAPNSAMPLLATGAGAVGGTMAGGPVGGVAGSVGGAFIGGTMIEVGAELDQIANELGYDMTKESGVLGFLSDQEAMRDAKIRAAKKGITTASVDALFQVFGGRFIKMAKTKVGKAGGAVADVATQMTGEGIGEAAGQQVARGEVDIDDAILEAVTAGVQSTGQTTIGAMIPTKEKFDVRMAEMQQKAEITDADVQALDSIESEVDTVADSLIKEFDEAAAMAEEDIGAGDVLPSLPPESRFEGFLEVGRDIKLATGKALTPISTRIKNISKPLFGRVRKFEFETKRKIVKDLDSAIPFLRKFKKLDKDVRQELSLALMNSDMDTVTRIANERGMAKELVVVKDMLDQIFDRAKRVGMETRYRADFYPRRVKNLSGLMSYLRNTEMWGVIEQAIEAKEKKSGALSDQQKSEVINTLMRGFQVEGVSLALRGQFKERTIKKVTQETSRFYEDPMTALIRYISGANEAIETSVLFGKAQKMDGDSADITDSVGSFVADMVKNGEINDFQARELQDIFIARFNEKLMGRVGAGVRDILYIDVMGSPLNAITQIGDMAVSMYNAGLIRTLTSIPRAMFDKTVVSLDELGITNVAQEFDNGSPTSKLVNTVFEYSGLAKIDRLGKRTVIQAHYKKIRAQAKRGTKKLKAELDVMFGDHADQVMQDLIDGNVTEDVKFVLFNRIMDFQPLSKLEMPEAYLRSGTFGKMAYMLKSFTIRQLDIYRREAIGLVAEGARTGNKMMVIEGLSNFVRLAGFWIAMNASAEFIKDYMRSLFGDDEMEEPKDYLIEGVWKSFFFSRYQAGMLFTVNDDGEVSLGRAHPAEVFVNMLIPPLKSLDNMWKDAKDIQKGKSEPKDLRAIRSIPIGGELYWFWFGGGSNDGSSKEFKF